MPCKFPNRDGQQNSCRKFHLFFNSEFEKYFLWYKRRQNDLRNGFFARDVKIQRLRPFESCISSNFSRFETNSFIGRWHDYFKTCRKLVWSFRHFFEWNCNWNGARTSAERKWKRIWKNYTLPWFQKIKKSVKRYYSHRPYAHNKFGLNGGMHIWDFERLNKHNFKSPFNHQLNASKLIYNFNFNYFLEFLRKSAKRFNNSSYNLAKTFSRRPVRVKRAFSRKRKQTRNSSLPLEFASLGSSWMFCRKKRLFLSEFEASSWLCAFAWARKHFSKLEEFAFCDCLADF